MLQFCPLASGSSGNALYIGSARTKILIDAGISCRQIGLRLAQLGVALSDLDAILVTHEHSDHTGGVRVLANRYRVPVYATEATWYRIEIERGEIGPKQYFTAGDEFVIGDLEVESFSLPHDAVDPVGFCISQGNTKISLATDLGHVPAHLEKQFAGSRLIFFEANHDEEMLRAGPYPWFLKQRVLGDRGHLSNTAAGEFLARVVNTGTTHLSLGHLSRNNNLPELAYLTVANLLAEQAIVPGRDVELKLNRHGEMGDCVELE